jgi:hypothetical protein
MGKTFPARLPMPYMGRFPIAPCATRKTGPETLEIHETAWTFNMQLSCLTIEVIVDPPRLLI